MYSRSVELLGAFTLSKDLIVRQINHLVRARAEVVICAWPTGAVPSYQVWLGRCTGRAPSFCENLLVVIL